MRSLSIVIPAYNEENGLVEIAGRVLVLGEPLRAAGIQMLELLVVDDGSTDRTAEIARQIEGVTLIQHPHNQGYGAALKTGFDRANGDLIGFLDADGTYPPEYFPQLCRAIDNGADLAVGSRRSGASSQMPPMRRLGNFIWSSLLSLLGNRRVHDPASGMRVFKREILARLYPLPDGLNLTPVMSTRAVHEQLTVTEFPIPYGDRVGRSKLSVVRDGSLFLQSIIWTALTYNPVQILGMIGLAAVGLALLTAVGLVMSRWQGMTTLGPWEVAALFVGLVAGFTGVSIFCLGVIFNYLVSLFYQRPVRQGLFGRPLMQRPLENHFGWLGLAGLLLGLGIGLASLLLGLNGWAIDRLWLYLLGSAMLILVGVQLIIYWILLLVLAELSQRDALTQTALPLPAVPTAD